MTGRFAPRPLEPVLRRLRTLASLSDEEVLLVRALTERRERHPPGEILVHEGETAPYPRFVISGWAARQRVLQDGRRQIFGFLVPGDPIALGLRTAEPVMGSVAAITAMETIDAEPVLNAIHGGDAPQLAAALAQAEQIERGLLLDHVVRLGRLTAYERVAHLLLELQQRLEIAGYGDAHRFPLPLTQEILADALGLSIVHVNRTLQQLRRERLIELRSGVAILLQRELLASLAAYPVAEVPSKRAASA